MRITIAQINTLVGDIAGNTQKIIRCAMEARDRQGSGLVIFPELAVTGYPPEDLLYRPDLYRQTARALADISSASESIDIIVGHPEREHEKIYNACSYLAAGRVQARYRKRVLPNYSVFDEKRYFTPGADTCIVDLDGVPTALTICEDLWEPAPSVDAARHGARLLININASPYHHRKLEQRRNLLQARAAETGLAIAYVNLVGGQDELVFDGASLIIAPDGRFLFQAPEFDEGLFTVELGPGRGTPSIRSVYALPATPVREQSIYRALVTGIRDYVHKNGFNGAVLGLSGGIDSALTLCLAVDALGADNVEALIMPSRYTAAMSIEDSVTLAQTLGARHHTVPIDRSVDTLQESLSPLFANLPADTTEENIQARCRGLLLMAVSNKTGRLVLATGNKSEMAVGYATLYGDMAGGFAPLKDVFKTLVYRLCRWRNAERPDIPQRIIERAPSAELRPDQKDEDTLPPYDVLDAILERYIELDRSTAEITSEGFDAETVNRVARMVDRNEYKRRQGAPGIKITERAFGRDRRYPITSAYREF